MPLNTPTLCLVRAPASSHPAHLALLSAEEQARHRAFATEPLRAAFACAHALLRSLLSACLGQAPDAITLDKDGNGRPRLASRQAAKELDFNLSASGPWIACALSPEGRIGVDLEAPGPRLEVHRLAPRVLSAREQEWLARQPDQRRAFCELWTLKEAIAKADGEGLGLDLQAFTAVPDGSGGLHLDLHALGAAHGWTLQQWSAPLPVTTALRDAEPSLRVVLVPPPTGLFEQVPAVERASGQILSPEG